MLGPLEVTGPDGPLAITGPMERAAMAVLVAWAGDVVTKERLVDALWGDQPPRSSIKVLHNLVSRLRKQLGADAIKTTPSGYVLVCPPESIDARHFEALVHEGRRCVSQGAWEPAAASFAAAAGLWRGSPLEELGDWPAAQAEAARWHEQILGVREELVAAELACGRHREWVGNLEVMVREEPLREQRWVLLMLALFRCGRQADAMRVAQRARAALAEIGLGPGPELVAVEHDISLGVDRSVPARASAGNLPRPATEIVGRAAEVAGWADELPTRRLVTLTGAGGIGKTRVAIEVAALALEHFPSGAWMVDLAAVTEPSGVAAAVGSTLGVPPHPGASMVASIVAWLRGRRLLLVLDNCEHLLPAVSELTAAIVTACPTVSLLATSREPLRVAGERVHVVPPLPVSPESVELFCERAAATGEFAPDDDDLVAITSICQHLDGMPLAIELAAGRMRTTTTSELLDRLDDRLSLLRRRGHGVPERHQTLHGMADWSYQLLDDRERLAFERVSVFAGEFDLAAAEAVCSGTGLCAAEVFDALGALVDKSMVVVDRTARGIRYRLLETLRQYGAARLGSEIGEWRNRHLAHYQAQAGRARDLWATPRQVEAHAIFEREWDNLRAAHTWAVSIADLDAADALVACTGPHAWCRLIHEHADWAARTVAVATRDRPANPATYGWGAHWAFIGGNFDRSIALAHDGIDAARSPDHPDTAWCWGNLAWANLAAGHRAEAREPARRAWAAASRNPDPFVRFSAHVAVIEEALVDVKSGVADAVAGLVEWAEGVGAPSLLARAAFYEDLLHVYGGQPAPPEAAAERYSRCGELARQVGDIKHEGVALTLVVGAATRCGLPGGGDVCRGALTRLYDTRYWVLLWMAVNHTARWLSEIGAMEAAGVVYGYLDRHRPLWDSLDVHARRDRGMRRVREHPCADEFMARGAGMGDDEIVEYLLAQLGALPAGDGSQGAALVADQPFETGT